MWVSINKEGIIYCYSDSDNYMYLENKDFVSGNFYNSNDDTIECVVVPKDEYQKLQGELLKYRLKEMGSVGGVSEVIMKD